MSEIKHTPGPWTIDPPGPHRHTSGFSVLANTPHGAGFPTPSATGHFCMALPPPHGSADAETQEANARLIAAAPDLLEALERVVFWHGKRREDEGLLPADEQLGEIARAMDAIAKATGVEL